MNEAVTEPGPIVIVGCQRSGTTMLRAMLGRHPDLLEHPDEPQFLRGLFHRFGHLIRDVPAATAYVSRHPYFPKSLSKDALTGAFSDAFALDLSQFARRYLVAWAGAHPHKRRPVVKDPAFIYDLDLALEFFPNATVVHIIRDPRANVASQRARWKNLTVWECARLWRDAIRAGGAWSTRHSTGYVEVRYERLVEDTEGALSKLCQQLQIPYSTDMRRFHLETTIHDPGRPPEHIVLQEADRSRSTLWKERLSPSDVRLIEFCCRKEMVDCGYRAIRPATREAALWLRTVHEWLHFAGKRFGRSIKAGLRRRG